MHVTTLFALALAGAALPQDPGTQETAERQEQAKTEKPGTEAAKPDPAHPKAEAESGRGQDAVDIDELLAPYLTEGLLGRLEVAPRIRAMGEDELANQALPKLTGERNRLILQVQDLIEGLGDVRYAVREQSEQALIHMGPLITPILESMRDQPDFEVRLRLERVIAKLANAGTEDIERKALIAAGLAESLEYRKGDDEARALLSALDSLDTRVRIAAIRSLGTMLQDGALAKAHGDKTHDRVRADVARPDLALRNAATAALGSMPGTRAAELLHDIAADGQRATSHRLLALRTLWHHHRETLGSLTGKLGEEGSELVAAALAFFAAEGDGGSDAVPSSLLLELKDGGKLETSVLGMDGDRILFTPSKEYPGLEALRIPRASVDEIRVAQAQETPAVPGIHVLLKSGTRLAVTGVRYDGKVLAGTALGREVRLPRSRLRGILPDPKRGRALGGSRVSDQIRLREGDDKIVKGSVTGFTDDAITLVDEKKETRRVAWPDIEAVLFQLDLDGGGVQDAGDVDQYVQVDLTTSERLVGFLLDLGPSGIALASGALGCFRLPLASIASVQLSNSGRALTGFTLVTDYGNTLIVEYDGEGREVWKLEDLFDPLDAELTPTGTILVTEQGDNAVREYDRDGNVTWEFTKVSRPLDADRLPNGNTLITDPGNFRVIEVTPEGEIVWAYGRKDAKSNDFKPYDADRLTNGNTLIADYSGEQVLEVSPSGQVVWRYGGTKYVCDADRLPSGNTLITMRQPAQVLEVTPSHTVVWKLTRLQLPWDADRLPDGTTIVSENFGVRVYSKDGKPLRKLAAEWASEANAY